MKVIIRYNFRNPPQWKRPDNWLYHRILDQIEWADKSGFHGVDLAEHHFTEDGFLPSLMAMHCAIAARTKQMYLGTAIMLAPLHNPVRLAETASIVDILCNGRLTLSFGAGYREEEYSAFGMRLKERAGRMEETLQILKGLWNNDEFSFEGKYYQLDKVCLTPRPVQPGGPKLVLGGGTEAVARRAARYADDMVPMNPALWDVYYEELEKLGRPAVPRPPIPPRAINFLHVTRDPERAWDQIRPHAIYEQQQYVKWGLMGSHVTSTGVPDDAALRVTNLVWTPEEALTNMRAAKTAHPDCDFAFAPLLPGMDPELGQASLDLLASEILPNL